MKEKRAKKFYNVFFISVQIIKKLNKTESFFTIRKKNMLCFVLFFKIHSNILFSNFLNISVFFNKKKCCSQCEKNSSFYVSFLSRCIVDRFFFILFTICFLLPFQSYPSSIGFPYSNKTYSLLTCTVAMVAFLVPFYAHFLVTELKMLM